MHLFFLCPFSKAAWYCFPWFIKTEFLAHQNSTISDMIQSLLSSQHPHINVNSLYTFLWCIWKARNDRTFCRKSCSPFQVYAGAMAILQGTKLELSASSKVSVTDVPVGAHLHMEHAVSLQDHASQQIVPHPGSTIRNVSSFTGPTVFSDAAWSRSSDGQPASAGLGIFMQLGGVRKCSQLRISAVSPPVTSAIQAEAFSMLLAIHIAGLLQLQQATFMTDSETLAKAAAAQNLLLTPGHWTIRSQLSHMTASPAFNASRIHHIPRSLNYRAHHQAKLALKVQNRCTSFRCLDSGSENCLNAVVFADAPVLQCTIVYVRCC